MRDFNRLFNEGHPTPNHMRNEVPGEGKVAAMSDISREELDAKLDGTLAKLSARLASFESAVREMLAAMRVDMVNLRAELRDSLADSRAEQRGDVADLRAELRVMQIDMSHLKNLKGNIWGAAVVTMGLVGAFLTYGVSSFDSGRDTSELFQELKQHTRETRLLLDEMKLLAPAAAAAPASKATP